MPEMITNNGYCSVSNSLCIVKLLLPQGPQASVRDPPRTRGSSAPHAHWPGAYGSLSPSASSRSASASSRSLSSGSPPVIGACTQPDPLGMATAHTGPTIRQCFHAMRLRN